MKITILIFILFAYNTLLASDSTLLECKYAYTKLKDSTNKDSKLEDIMMLVINKRSTLFYSYLKQLGNRNLERDVMKNNFTSEQVVNNRGNYFTRSETEVITKDNLNKTITFSDELTKENCYEYTDIIAKINWKLEKDTMTIMGYSCQKATCNFKGRNYIAWFANEINIPEGPWLFYGLPGLILKVSDDKMQFIFECTALAPKLYDSKHYKEYNNCKSVKKTALRELKRFKAQDPIHFMETTTGKTVTQTAGNNSIYGNSLKPYNPIDLTP